MSQTRRLHFVVTKRFMFTRGISWYRLSKGHSFVVPFVNFISPIFNIALNASCLPNSFQYLWDLLIMPAY